MTDENQPPEAPPDQTQHLVMDEATRAKIRAQTTPQTEHLTMTPEERQLVKDAMDPRK